MDMDVDTRFHTRTRAPPFNPSQKGMSGVQDDSSGESESNLVRRKFARTSTDPTDTTSDSAFRKPSLPASATRPAGLEHRPSLTQRRRSTLRENVRVPSGPREFPSPSKQRLASVTSNAPAASNNARPFLPQSNSDAYLYNSRTAGAGNVSRERLTLGHPTTSSTPATASTKPGMGGKGLEFLPDINFDDFQTSIKNYDGTSPMLSEFPSLDGGRILSTGENHNSMAKSNGVAGGNAQAQQQQDNQKGMTRTQSLRQRLGAGRQASGTQQMAAKDGQAESKPSSLRNRRQSAMPQTNTAPMTSTAKPPRKSVGPGMITSMMKGNNGQQSNADAQPKSGLARTSSLSKTRRSTLQPSASAGAELPRFSTLTATTQSRQNKVKSLQPPARDLETNDSMSTPSSVKSSKANQNRAHTPSSGSGRRQSMASGRASGLGARTVSPTDARRLKRMSMNNPPPLPTAYLGGKVQVSPQEELPNPMNNVPRMAQPSPSLIPRKTSNATPSSARASPEAKLYSSGVSLASKSSFSSLVNMPTNGSSSRLPTPKPRSGMQSSSSLAQYDDQYSNGDYSELVPPVPAIPKAWESPQDEDHRPFFSSLKSSQSSAADKPATTGYTEVTSLPAPQRLSQVPRNSFDSPMQTPPKRSSEFTRHARIKSGNTSFQIPPPPAQPKTVSRMQPDPNGRKNANLQPLRLPPLNLMPITTRTLNSNATASLPRPSQETDSRDPTDWHVQTPEPKRVAKTPSTPMTASKATFFRRQDEKAVRSSSSHFALRDVMGMESDGNMMSKFWDDSDIESAGNGVPIPTKQGRSAITPFASGSLPKANAEFAKQMRGRPSGEYDDDPYSLGNFEGWQWQASKPQGPRLRTGTQTTVGSTSMKSPLEIDSPSVLEPPSLQDAKDEVTEKKEGSGLRRKLSIGWRRASSKAANHAENKSSPRLENGVNQDKKETQKLQKRGNDMPPPRLPASATWSGDVSSLSSNARPSMEQNSVLSHARRKSQLPASTSTVSIPSDSDNTTGSGHIAGPKTRSTHHEQPTPVTSNNRASSWGNLGPNSRVAASKNQRHRMTASTISAIIKDKDDYAADEEMARLSRKRKDVDAAARETEEIKQRAIARSPVSTETVLHDRSLLGGSQLNVFERGEIVDYEKEGIYFTGTHKARKIIGSLTPSPQPGAGKEAGGTNNFGYDDERGDYNIILGDHLAYRYEVVDVLGKGSFGQVVRCVDHKEGGVVAVKIIRNKKRFHQQALVEVGILGRLREWDPDGTYASLSITSSFYFRSHLCIVTPCLSINLYELIRAHNFTGFPLPLIRRFSRQLLATLTLLHSKRIIHCDLKPENILLCEARKADVRVIDFGSSCREEEKVYTYIQSRFYRSPEVILGSSYGLGIDMWSFGCILAELWTGYPLFPGENEQEQLACIMEIFGPPDRHLVERCTRKKLFFDSVGKPRVTVSSKGRRRRPSSKTLQQALKSEDEAFVDFVGRCLRWDPERRMKPAEAVGHPFVTGLPRAGAGIPEEARRAARVRSQAAAAGGGGGAPSPVKKAVAQQTPVKTRAGGEVAGTPQTAVRNGFSAAATGIGGGAAASPSKTNKRQSSVANAAATSSVAGVKRGSGGLVAPVSAPSGMLGAGMARGAGGSASAVSLAQMAARESMGAAAGTNGAGGGGSGRWRGQV